MIFLNVEPEKSFIFRNEGFYARRIRVHLPRKENGLRKGTTKQNAGTTQETRKRYPKAEASSMPQTSGPAYCAAPFRVSSSRLLLPVLLNSTITTRAGVEALFSSNQPTYPFSHPILLKFRSLEIAASKKPNTLLKYRRPAIFWDFPQVRQRCPKKKRILGDRFC